MSKPKIAIFDFACCEGCQLQIVNMEEAILDLLAVVEPVEWREAISDQSEVYDIAIVEGSITRKADEAKLLAIREQATYVIAMGACATMGGVNKLKNNFEMSDVRDCVYGESADMPHLDTYPVKALHELIKVDYDLHGCPIDASELVHVVKALLAGTIPTVPDYPVCVECKLRENCCRYEYNEVCLGPITRAGCDARCPSNGLWCFGCRGTVDDPNVKAAKDVMAEYGRTVEDLEDRMVLFGTR